MSFALELQWGMERFSPTLLVTTLSKADCLGRAYENGQFTDLTIICGEKHIAVHKLVVCTHSRIFEKACTNGFEV